MSEQHFLPHEIVVEILCRLPSKSLLKFRCVCKSWNSLITDPSFITRHRLRSNSLLLLHLFKKDLVFHSSLNHHHHDHLLTLSDYSLPLPASSIRAFRQCHGLLCLSRDRACSSLIICNPSLRRFLRIPKPNCYSVSYRANFAFGFDSRNHDYKIVRISSMFDEMFGYCAPTVEVYSLASGIWRTLAPDAAPVCVIDGAAGSASCAFVNGIVHWAAERRIEDRGLYCFVLSFNFVDEVFDEVALPEHLSSSMASVNVVGGSHDKPLTVYIIESSLRSASIWVMKEYAVVKSWNKLFTLDLNGSCLKAPYFGLKITSLLGPKPRALCTMNNGEILLLTMEKLRKRGIYLLDVEKTRFKNIQFGGQEEQWSCIYADYYAESLVLLENISAMMSY